jgi:hypothetical protein
MAYRLLGLLIAIFENDWGYIWLFIKQRKKPGPNGFWAQLFSFPYCVSRLVIYPDQFSFSDRIVFPMSMQ